MQNNPDSANSGNQPPNPFGGPPPTRPAFSFLHSQAHHSGPFAGNPFKKINKAPTGLYGMNISPQSAPTAVFGSRPRTQAPFPHAPSTSLDNRSPFRFSNKDLLKLQSIAASQVKKEEPTTTVAQAITETSPETETIPNPTEEEAAVEHGLPEVSKQAKSKGIAKKKASVSPDQKLLKRTFSTDVSQLQSIAVYEIPENLNTKLELTKHFQAFGNITKIIPNAKKGNASITFSSHDAAAKAKKFGTKLGPDVELKILWRQLPVKERKPMSASKTTVTETAIAQPRESDELPRKHVNTVPKKVAASASNVNLSEGLPMQISAEELKAVLLQPARTAADKATVLDARDRLVRIKKEGSNKSASDVKAVAVLTGTCPDMCPEKERYLRVEKRRLASYEILVNEGKDYEVDHRLAVKEYSRSSADQAEPLAHELRPLPVLKMTMDYLIASIMDRCDRPSENLAEWFNFLWDRTRGIRKDVTQQSLCELGAVDLVEQCARFHIHCTARLCELDMQDFDQKINDENLTKCMQTLKHMYYDLSVKQIHCPNEAEFRSYDILLHLNVGDILREVQQLRDEVRESPKVRAALQFFNALNSRNYVRFFRLAMCNDDYLMCCLLQRYFHQIRNSALQIMVQAFGPPKKAQIPLSNLVDVLGFEDQNEAADWCQHHGLPVEVDKDILFLERSNFIQMPESFPAKRRSLRLIESKRHCSVGQVIANGPVDASVALRHQAHISFDEQGLLLRESWLAEDQSCKLDQPPPCATSALSEFVQEEVDEEEEEGAEPSAPPPPYVAPAAAPPPPAYGAPQVQEQIVIHPAPNLALILEVSKALYQQTIGSVTQEMILETGQKYIRNIQVARLCQKLLDETVENMCLEVARKVITELESAKRRELEERLMLERTRQYLTQELLKEVVDTVVHQLVRSLGGEAIRAATEERAATRREELSQDLFTSVLNHVADSESQTLSSAVAQETIAMRESLVKRARQRVLHRRVAHCFERWRFFTVCKVRRRAEKQTFPAGPSHLTFDQQVLSLSSKGETRGSASIKRKSVVDLQLHVKRLNDLSDLHFSKIQLEKELDKASLDMFSILEPTLRSRLHKAKSHSWKLTILSVTPVNKKSDSVGRLLRRWLGLHSSAESSAEGWTYTETKHSGRPLTLSVTYTDDISDLRGANALLLVVHCDDTDEAALRHLSSALTAEAGLVLPANVAVLEAVSSNSRPMDLAGVLAPLRLCGHLRLDFTSPPVDRLLKLSQLLVSIVESTQCLWPVGVKTATLWDLVDDFLMKKTLPTICHDLENRLFKGLLHQPLSVLVDYHNYGIEQLANSLTDVGLRRIQWPAGELAALSHLNLPPIQWNSPTYQAEMAHILKKHLILPAWSEKDYDFADACQALRDYCRLVAAPGADSSCLLSRLDSLVAACLSQFRAQLPRGVPQTANLPWTQIYQACVDFRLQAFVADGRRSSVGFFAETVDRFADHPSWVDASSSVALSQAATLRQTLERSQSELDARDLTRPATTDVDLPPEISALCQALTESNRQARLENERFEARLNAALMCPTSKATPAEESPRWSIGDIHLGDLDAQMRLLEQNLERSRCEDRHLESYMRRVLKE